jgi:pyruvate/2-oxoglutarate dehydrogenase complex dihydrolipoamide acyltransferase (E2) component
MWERYRGGAVLVSSPAKYGVDAVNASWAWPIGVSFGFVEQRPVVRNGQIAARPCFTFLMNFDRRVMAGAAAARFFRHICCLLESGKELVGDSPSR